MFYVWCRITDVAAKQAVGCTKMCRRVQRLHHQGQVLEVKAICIIAVPGPVVLGGATSSTFTAQACQAQVLRPYLLHKGLGERVARGQYKISCMAVYGRVGMPMVALLLFRAHCTAPTGSTPAANAHSTARTDGGSALIQSALHPSTDPRLLPTRTPPRSTRSPLPLLFS